MDRPLYPQTCCSGSGQIWLLLGDGNGGFTPAASGAFAAGIKPVAIVVADFNGDGKADLAIANQNDDTVSVLLGNGDASFIQAPGSPIPVPGPVALAVGDLNGDGNADLAVADSIGDKVAILFGSSSGALTISHTFFPASNPTAIVVGDFNGDGKNDLAYTNAGSSNVTVLPGGWRGQLQRRGRQSVPSGFGAVLFGDWRL